MANGRSKMIKETEPMETLDKRMKETEISQRRKFIISQLAKVEIYKTSDGRDLKDVSLYTLEWTYTEAKNAEAKAYSER